MSEVSSSDSKIGVSTSASGNPSTIIAAAPAAIVNSPEAKVPPTTLKASPSYSGPTTTPATILTTPSTRPTTRTNTGGLSELSKQLRILQARNETQNVEIDRLERQLRILSDLQGISVNDLRHALQSACEAEAHGELQHRVASLRAQLEAVSLAKEQSNRKTQTDSLQHKVANLQLRIGELEEIDEKQKDEIKSLYHKVFEQKEMNVNLESKVLLLQQQYDTAISKYEQEIVVLKSSAAPETDNAEAIEVGRDVIAVSIATDDDDDTKDEKKSNDGDDDNHTNNHLMSLESSSLVIESQREVAVLNEKLELLTEQIENYDEQSRLRTAQYKARFMIQDERIQDLEQQLSSLYTAFNLMSQERNEEMQSHQLLKLNLDNADAQVARQVSHFDNNNNMPRQKPVILQNIDTTTGNVVVGKNESSFASDSASDAAVASPNTASIPSTALYANGDRVIAGTLLVRSTNAIGLKKWKKKKAVMYAYDSHFQFEISGSTHKDTYSLHSNISRIEVFNKKVSGGPPPPVSNATSGRYNNSNDNFAFTLRVNFIDQHSPTLYIAAEDKISHQQWLAAFSLATTGLVLLKKPASANTPTGTGATTSTPIIGNDNATTESNCITKEIIHEEEGTTSEQYQPPPTSTAALDPEDQEALDLARALEESKRDLNKTQSVEEEKSGWVEEEEDSDSYDNTIDNVASISDDNNGIEESSSNNSDLRNNYHGNVVTETKKDVESSSSISPEDQEALDLERALEASVQDLATDLPPLQEEVEEEVTTLDGINEVSNNVTGVEKNNIDNNRDGDKWPSSSLDNAFASEADGNNNHDTASLPPLHPREKDYQQKCTTTAAVFTNVVDSSDDELYCFVEKSLHDTDDDDVTVPAGNLMPSRRHI